MQNSGFENTVRQKMEELKIVPSDKVWSQLDAELPKEKKKSKWFFLFLIFAGLFTASLLFYNKMNKEQIQISKIKNAKEKISIPEIKNNESKTITHSNQQVLPGNKNEEIASNTENGNVVIKDSSQKNQFSKTEFNKNLLLNYKYKEQNVKTKSDKLFQINNDQNEGNFKSPSKNNLADPMPADANQVLNETVNSNHLLKDIFYGYPIPPIDLKYQLNRIVLNTIDTNRLAIIVKSEFLPSDADFVKKEKAREKHNSNSLSSKSKISKWQFGATIGMGISNVKSNLFSAHSSIYGPAAFTNANASTGNYIMIPNHPSPDFACNAAFFADYNLNKNWKFSTGVSYLFASNNLKVGKGVDSILNVNSYSNRFQTQNYFRSGSTVNYKNKFHLLEIPLLMQYQFSKQFPIFLEAGPSFNYLISSNALVADTNAYFTNKIIFNRFLVSLNAGAGIKIAQKSKRPFELGFRFNYSLGSATKTDFAREHLLNTLFYLKIPFKK